jgi:methionine sulfoxide reductase heme-binding subunit
MGRVTRHIILFLLSAATCAVFYLAFDSQGPLWRLSMASAYGSLALLALSLMIGPWNRLRRRPNPVSGYLRRDIGIWAGVLGIVHVVFGLQVHFVGRMWLYFVPETWRSFPLRLDLFGFTNYAGLAATLILVLLLALSNDASLRALGPARWKSLQRWNYAGAALVVAHGIVYMVLEKRTPAFIAAFAVLVLLAAGLQLAGYRAVSQGGR